MTNRGVGRSIIFNQPIDHFVFVAILASVCLDCGIRVHSFCLLTNHFHLLLEDPRGVLSIAMLRVQTAYARYFRDVYGTRGSGHVFGDRFRSRPITSAHDYRRVVRYILRNPLECRTPLASSAWTFLWSNAAPLVGAIAPATWAADLVAGFGGVDALLASLPKPRTKQLEQLRRTRMECLLGGEWLAADSARQGLSGEEFASSLAERTESSEPDGEEMDPMVTGEVAPAPRSLPEYSGVARTPVIDAFERLTGEPAGRGGGVLAYVLWRFSRDGRRQMAKTIGMTADEFVRTVRSIARTRLTNPAANEALGRLEWRLTFALGGAPWRV